MTEGERDREKIHSETWPRLEERKGEREKREEERQEGERKKKIKKSKKERERYRDPKLAHNR